MTLSSLWAWLDSGAVERVRSRGGSGERTPSVAIVGGTAALGGMTNHFRSPLGGLPDTESSRIDNAIGDTLIGITLCGMRGCAESFYGVADDGIHQLTWGVVFSFESNGDLAITWTQDVNGNPYRIAAISAEELLAIESVVPEDVSSVTPWSSRIGRQLEGVMRHSYETNWAYESSMDTWHAVTWGLEFIFLTGNFLVAAAQHDSCLSDPTASDEIVIAYTPKAIGELRALRDGHREKWFSAQ